MKWNPEKILADFLIVAELAAIEIQPSAIYIETLTMPHRPPSSLPKGKMAVYVFSDKECVLKVGKIGQKSQARYTSQHYNPHSSNSNLAKSILKDEDAVQKYNVNDGNISDWIKKNTDRVNFLLYANVGMRALTLLEVFIQCRLLPVYEGFSSQQ